MPSKTKMKNAAIAARSAALPSIPKELIDQFVTGPMSGDAVNAASMAFKKALIERAMGAELGHHLGYAVGSDKPADASNQRNGKSGKTVLTGEGPLRIAVPRDREGSFEPILIPKHERRFTGFDDKIIAMYARGMTMREIQGFLLESYGVEVSAVLQAFAHDPTPHVRLLRPAQERCTIFDADTRALGRLGWQQCARMPRPFLCTDASIVASSATTTALTDLGSTAAVCARCAIRLARLNAVLIGFISVTALVGVAALAAFFTGAVFAALVAIFSAGTLVVVFFAVAMWVESPQR